MFLPTASKLGCIWLLIQLCNTAENKRYKKLPGYVLRPATLLWTDDVSRSLTQCLVICKQTEHCYAISVTSSTGYCAYHNWLLVNGTPIVMENGTDNDFVILVKPITCKLFFCASYYVSITQWLKFLHSARNIAM